MLSAFIKVLAAASLLGSALAHQPQHLKVRATSVAAYIATQSPISKAGILANIGPSGAKSEGAASGVVIASPSTTNPDYL